MNIHDIIISVANGALEKKVAETGHMPSGNNGPWNDPDTPVRNTAHWTIIFLKAYQITGEKKFWHASKRTTAYLQSNSIRPRKATFKCRTNLRKDNCNGLIGQAWVIEALVLAAQVLEQQNLIEIAERVFLFHPQDQRTGLWKRVEIDGETLPFMATFNQQLWFAAAGGLLADYPGVDGRIENKARTFLNELETNLRLYPSGLIFHPLKPTGSLKRLLHLVRADEQGRIGLTFLTSSVPLPSRRRDLKWKAIGYHAFNLYAFALLKQQYPDHNFWKTSKWKRALEYVTTSEYRDAVWQNEYGSPYNPVGFEVPFAMEVFGIGTIEERRQLITKQLKGHYNSDTNRMDRNTRDEETLTARIYQATRLDDISLPEFEPK